MAARSEGTRGGFALDPVTFEVLKNSFIVARSPNGTPFGRR